MKGFFDRNYSILLALRLDENKLWHRATWTGVSERLRSVTRHARGPAAVRCMQLHGRKKVAFGRLGLDDTSSSKWNRDSVDVAGEPREFVSTEVWAPHWNICEREGLAPDVFVMLTQPFSSMMGFDQALLVAVEEGLTDVCSNQLEEFTRFLGGLPGVRVLAQTKRPWGEPMLGGTGYSNGIQDFLSTGLYYPYMKWPIDLERTRWQNWISVLGGNVNAPPVA